VGARSGRPSAGNEGGWGEHALGTLDRLCAVADVPETLYAKTPDGAHIAYQLLGNGPLDLLLLPIVGVQGHLEMAWEIPAFARVFRRLASFGRLIRFDPRGSGLSDPLGRSDHPSLEERAAELLAVLDAVGSERVAVVANNIAGVLAIFFAASYPARVSALVLDGCYARFARDADYSWGWPREAIDAALADIAGSPESAFEVGMRMVAPRALQDDPEFRAQYLRYTRSTLSLSAAKPYAEWAVLGDVRPLLPSIQAPTLVLCRSGDQYVRKPHSVYLAQHVAGAKFVELPGEDNLIYVGDSDADLDEIEEFLTGARHVPDTGRVLATVLFTDIVGSTQRAAGLGDRRWRELLDAHDRAVRRQLERFRGREVSTVGDSFVATFDGPGRAIECACAIRDAVRTLGIEVRAGLHTGEIEIRGDDIAGMAVHIGARVASLADAGQVLVSSTVKDLVAGSGIEFDDRGEHQLKGVPGRWHLYSANA
jgi:class 3 adenylate cyclase/alpha-beta hydrolase superfamily lysophospholipase